MARESTSKSVSTLSGMGTAPAPTGSGPGLTTSTGATLSGMGTAPAPTGRTTKGSTATWRDWLPKGAPEPDDLLTREEVLDRLRSWSVEATVNDLRYWEYEGILPRAVKRQHDGAVRAVYPEWFPHLVRHLRDLQAEGLTLNQITPRLRTHARLTLAIEQASMSTLARDRAVRIPPWAKQPEDIQLGFDVAAALEKVADAHAKFRGVPVARIEVHVIGTDGRATKYPMPIAAAESINPSER